MTKTNAEFCIDSNVYVKVIDAHNRIQKEIMFHNKATKLLVTGILKFIQGHFTISNRQPDESMLIYKNSAKDYIPCYVNLGKGGVIGANSEDKRIPVLSAEWTNEKSRYTDKHLADEIQNGIRVEIGKVDIPVTTTGDISQIIYNIEIPPGHCTGDTLNSCFITELGLFSTSNPVYKDGLLARVVITDPKDVLYIRPQDTIIMTWSISILALDDDSTIEETDENNNTTRKEYVNTIDLDIPVENNIT